MFDNFIIALNCVTPMFLTLCVGILLRASKIVPEEAFHHLSQISFHAFLPCLMFSNLYSADLSGTDHATIFVYLVAWVVVWFLLCTAVCSRLEPDLRRRGAYIQSGYRTNIAVVGVSLAQSMMGNNGVALMSMAVGLVVPTYNTLAVITLESCRGKRPDPVHLVKSILRNPLIIGCALGGLCLGLHITLPGSVVKAVSSVGNAGSVTTLVALGASLKLGGMQHNLAAIVRCSFVRLVLAPLCAHIVCCAPANARALPAEELAEQLRPGCGDVRTAGSPRQALRLAEELAHGGDLLVAGSFFLAAELRPLLLLDMREGRLS